MFKRNGTTIDITQDLVIGECDDAITIPAGSLQDAATREQYGIVNEPDPVRADERFYWNGDLSTPRDIAEVKARMIAEVKQTANVLLSPTDWKVVRAAENGEPVDQTTKDYRAAVRQASNDNEAAINAKAKVSTLAALVLSWPEAP